jgi:RNA polymerase sigma factor (sigma-70 family)
MSPIVFVVDDDLAVRTGVTSVIEAAGLQVSSFDSAEGFLAEFDPEQAGCILVDIRLPRMTGTELHAELIARGVKQPVIFCTAHGDVATSVRALHAGAFDFLEKPVEGALLLERVRAALATDAQRHKADHDRKNLEARLARLTPRERTVMELVVQGHSSKEIATALGISHRTVEVYRSRIMEKLRVPTLLQLAIFAEACGLAASLHLLPGTNRSGG